MNIKLLKELYKQAETECGWSEEKFAELIVFECTKVIVFGGYRNHAVGEKTQLTPVEIATMIKEHFGVEE